MAASFLPIDRRGRPAVRVGSICDPFALRTILIVGCVVAVALVAVFARPSDAAAADPELAYLLRGMAAIKGVMVLAAIGLLTWRFGHPLSGRLAGVYLTATWIATAATAMVWQLSTVPLAAIAFHAGELSFLAGAWLDHKAHAGHSHGKEAGR